MSISDKLASRLSLCFCDGDDSRVAGGGGGAGGYAHDPKWGT